MTSNFDALRIHDSASKLLNIWLDIRLDHQVCPSKKNFLPMSLGRTLPDVFLVEWQAHDRVMIRVAGSRTSEITAGDKTGMNIFDVCQPKHVLPLQNFYTKMIEGRTAGVTEQTILSTHDGLVAKAVQLPLLDNDGEPRFFVGALRRVPLEKKQQNILPLSHTVPTGMNIWFRNLPEANVSLTEKAM